MMAESTGVIPRRARGRPRLEDVAAIEDTLLDAAFTEFVKHGYGGASINRIVVSAGVAKRTLYCRFASKEMLFKAIVDRQIERLAPVAALRLSPGKPDLKVGLQAYANRAIESNLEGDMLEVARMIFSESHRFPELSAAADEGNKLGIAQISTFIRECAAADGIPCKDPDATAEALIALLFGWHSYVLLSRRRVAASVRKRWVERAVDVLLSGRPDW